MTIRPPHATVTRTLKPARQEEQLIDAQSPCEYSEEQEKGYICNTDAKRRKGRGQFFTPPEIARFMAELASGTKSEEVRVLDPGAGTGALSCALFENLAANKLVKRIELDAYENDGALIPFLRESLEYGREWLQGRGIELDYRVLEEDFILATSGLNAGKKHGYDIVIGNPPYFKIRRTDPRALAAHEFVHGQPNIYVLFMGRASALLGKKGVLVFITPRSFASGPYFKKFRKTFFNEMALERIHVFHSRRDAFSKHSVLQENIIIKVRKGASLGKVSISSSDGLAGIGASRVFEVDGNLAVFRSGTDVVLRLPTDSEEERVLKAVDAWTQTLFTYDLKVSTGPIVPFRAEKFLKNERTGDALEPMLWMKNVQAMIITWPYAGNGNGKKKPPFILRNPESQKRRLFVKNANCVILRRFSAKEQPKRLIAAPLLKGQFKSEYIGIENHLNYVYRPNGVMNNEETLGLAALLNSDLLEKYFRIMNGNTQVSASEIRAMPLPEHEKIIKIGKKMERLAGTLPQNQINRLVMDTLLE